MTGFTSLQYREERSNLSIKKIDVPASIVKALRESGHEVDWRKVTPGEDLSGYDVAWVNLAPANSLNGRAGAMGALYTLGSGLPTVGFHDDWQFHTVYNGARAVVRKPEMLYKHLLVGAKHRGGEAATHFSRESAQAALDRIIARDPALAKKVHIERYFFTDNDENVKDHEDTILKAASALISDRWAAGMVSVCPMYGFGDRTKVRKRMPKTMSLIEALDPSPTINDIVAQREHTPPEEKERAWVLGALMPHDTWLEKQKLEWPIEILGSRKMVAKYGGKRLDTEVDVLNTYSRHWGILSPPYPHAGCGWWRSRFIYSAAIGSVLVSFKGEGDPIGDAYKVTPQAVEAMSTSELAALAHDQSEQLIHWLPPYEAFVSHVNHIIHRAVREDRGLKL